jgi:hypothetical protein
MIGLFYVSKKKSDISFDGGEKELWRSQPAYLLH